MWSSEPAAMPSSPQRGWRAYPCSPTCVLSRHGCGLHRHPFPTLKPPMRWGGSSGRCWQNRNCAMYCCSQTVFYSSRYWSWRCRTRRSRKSWQQSVNSSSNASPTHSARYWSWTRRGAISGLGLRPACPTFIIGLWMASQLARMSALAVARLTHSECARWRPRKMPRRRHGRLFGEAHPARAVGDDAPQMVQLSNPPRHPCRLKPISTRYRS
jgi:hypothetical protein